MATPTGPVRLPFAASMEVPSPIAGEVVSLKVKTGDKVNEGDLVIEVKGAGQAASASAAPTTTQNTASASTETLVVPDIGGDSDVDAQAKKMRQATDFVSSFLTQI